MKFKRKSNKISYGTISLPLPLIEKIKEKMNGTGMTSVSSYVSFVLRQIFSGDNIEKDRILSRNDEEDVRNRLKNLGYI